MNANLDRFRIKSDLTHALIEVFRGTAEQAMDLGFEYCSFHIRFPLPVSNPSLLMFDNYPEPWHTRYHQKNYLNADPTLKHALHYQTAQVWSDSVFAKHREMWHDMQAHDLKIGWAQPTRDAKNVVGLLTVARAEGPLDRDELKKKQPLIAWLAQTTHLAINRKLAPHFMRTTNTSLSRRELDVLRWTAEGKTSSEISTILTISERTVNFHANNAVLKLGVANKTAAAAHAALLGMF